MVKRVGFDNEKYLKEQTAAISDRVKKFDNKLYLEFGGKLCFDYHAARVLPGYDPNVKIRLLQLLKDKIDIVLCIYAGDIEKGRVRGDFGITYDVATLKLIDDLRKWGLDIVAVVITRFTNQPTAVIFKNKLERRGVKVYLHYPIEGYPANIDLVTSEEGFGKNEYIETQKPIVIVTGPGPGSGKLATCLSQLYQEHKRRVNAGYAKFETFPIWNIPLKHPVNVAYEAATADIQDFNLVDPFHLNTYSETAINYNRDVESFPILKLILGKIFDKGAQVPMYNSPTDMGVNRAGFGIVDDAIVQEAAKQELIRRYFRYNSEYVLGIEKKETVDRVMLLMEELGVKITDRSVVEPARVAAEEAEAKAQGNAGIYCGAAIELKDGRIITGKNSHLMHAASSLILNATKVLANIPDEILLLSPHIINQISKLKEGILNAESESLDLEETLIALSISATTNHTAELAMKKLVELKGCEVHTTHIPTPGDEVGLKRLGVNLTTDGKFSSRNLFVT
ncbi:MAG: DUF1846 domain-containing protein [Candidatus Omnitrophica bacterium]|nr:DUF1846 domain-containing protein [Candidatus Omnitrophota bacterium]MDD5592115.1 DUF1846 domain-containing protein [Candidatus Omnitrophota bacterium]